ncbi:MAG: heparan-alpha-glucosaminide N-acetyltransferase [Thermoplasmatota archaeon]
MIKKKNSPDRFIELDILRGLGIIAMIIFHLLWDLDYFGILELNRTIYGTNIVFQLLFFVLVGITLSVQFNKKPDFSSDVYKKIMFHGIWIFSLGVCISFVTFLVIPEHPVIFGVLHCIGLSILLSIPFLRLKQVNLFIAMPVIAIGFFIRQYHIANPSFGHFLIGFYQPNVWQYTLDYFPILPWFGIVLFGIGLGNVLYKDNKRRFRVPHFIHCKPGIIVSVLGKHSLVVYFCHQPIMIGALSLYVLI